jgi:hypothetical protein
MKLKLNLWEREFAADDYRVVYAAVRLFMKSGGAFSPTIGELREKMASFTEDEELPEQAAWAMVAKACANGLYGYQKEFAKLPEAVQRAVGAPEQLKAWAAMDAETVSSVVASNFMRNYRAQAARDREAAMLPPEYREKLAGIVAGMKMIGGSDDGSTV